MGVCIRVPYFRNPPHHVLHRSSVLPGLPHRLAAAVETHDLLLRQGIVDILVIPLLREPAQVQLLERQFGASVALWLCAIALSLRGLGML